MPNVYDSVNQQAPALGSNLGSTIGVAGCRSTLTQRLQKSVDYHQQETTIADKRRELIYLLEKNPEIARILDLFDEIGDCKR